MAFTYQFELYPSGDPSLYKTILNSPSGVSAIRDRMTGISEHSMSGVAFYINKIEQYFNTHNIGTSGDPVVSGYFSNIGYVHPDETVEDWPYNTTSNGLVSGVSEIWTSGVLIDKDNNDLYFKKLIATSGTFYNVILDTQSIGPDQYLTSLTLDSSGLISDSYYGYSHSLATDITKINPTKLLSNSGIIIDGIYATSNYGVIGGSLITNNITHSGAVIVSGNIHIDTGTISLDSATGINEAVINFNKHAHSGGFDGKQVNASVLNSNEDIDNSYSITLVSGDMTVRGDLDTPSIGLYNGWEKVPISSTFNNYQGLRVLSDRLYVYDDIQIGELIPGSITKIKDVTNSNKQSTIDGVSITSDININNGLDTVAAFSFGSLSNEDARTSGFINHNITLHNTEDSSLSRPDGEPSTPGTPVNGEKRKDNNGNFHRIFGNIYYTTYDEWSNTNGMALTIWNFNDNNKIVAAIEVENFESDMVFMKGFELDGSLVLPYRVPSSLECGSIVYNPVYQFPSDTGLRKPETYGNAQWFTPYGNPMSGVSSSISENYRLPTDYAYYDNSVYYLCNSGIYKCSMSTRNEPVFYDTGKSGSSSILAYAGKIWTGQTLETSFTIDGDIKTDSRIVDSLGALVAGNSDPWVASPVVHDGWIYALAPTSSGYSDWVSHEFVDKYVVNYNVPKSIVVRRRASELDLTKHINIYTE